jgi:inosose dehydratase
MMPNEKMSTPALLTAKQKRRDFLTALLSVPFVSFTSQTDTFPVSCNDYGWNTFYRREGKNWGGADLQQNIAAVAQTGLKAFEPNISDAESARALVAALGKYKIAMPSVYIGSGLHEPKAIEDSIARIMAIAQVVKSYGTKIIVTNPNPISWGEVILKTDYQLDLQAEAMERLGNLLREQNMILAYHIHGVELKAGAREFHHVMLNTTPKNVSFCFDVHWIYRGSENSQLAVFDVLKLYGARVVELHIRQSHKGVWSETFSAEGDIDYRKLADALSIAKVKPLIVIEQCLEKGSPETMDAVAAHKQNLRAASETFKKLL